MKRGEVASGLLVADGDLVVHGGQQRAGAAREVAYAQIPDSIGVRPVHAVHPFGRLRTKPFGRLRTELGDREACQQRGGRGQRVEGGEVLAVSDESLEDAAGEVVGLVGSGGLDVFDGGAESGE